MRLAVIGTSNSVLRGGYTAGLADHPATAHVANFSLGASTTVVLPKVWAEQDLGGFDFILLDFAVNEEYWVGVETSSLAGIASILDDFVSRLGQKTVPVVVVMPAITGLGRVLPVHDFYRAYARERGYPLYDGFDYVTSRSAGEDASKMFMDRDHLARDHARAFGRHIADGLAGLSERPLARGHRTAALPDHRFHAIAADELTGGAFVRRQTSLTSVNLARLGPWDRIALAFDHGVEIIGVGVNLAQSNGGVSITSPLGGRHVGLAGSQFKGDGISLSYVVLPMEPLAGVAFEIAAFAVSPTVALLELAGITIRGAVRQVDVPVFRQS